MVWLVQTIFGQMFNTTTFYCSSITPFSDYFKKKPTCLIWKYLIGTPQSLKSSKAHFHWFFTASHRFAHWANLMLIFRGNFCSKQNIWIRCSLCPGFTKIPCQMSIWLCYYLCRKIISYINSIKSFVNNFANFAIFHIFDKHISIVSNLSSILF